MTSPPTDPSSQRSGTWLAQPIIFLTGFSFLLYEVAWNRLLALVLGATVTAATLVLATFMAGFGAGAFFWGGIANRSGKPGALLGGLLGGMGLLSILNYKLMTGVLAQASGPGPFLAAVVLLFLPAFLMGGVFPVLSRLAVPDEQHMGQALGRLYAVETLGSALGGLLTGFVLLGTLGQRDTIFAAAALNLVLATVANLAPGLGRASAPAVAREAPTETPATRTAFLADPTFQRPALLGAFVSGLAILGLQVLWMRMFRIYVTNTSYTFSLVSSVSILGLFAGSFLFSWRQGRESRQGKKGTGRDLRWSLYKTLLGIIISAGVGLFLLLNLPELLMFPFAEAMGSPTARALLMPLVAALLIIFPPTLFSGYAFPLVCRMYAGDARNVSRDVGRVLMTNTLGSTLGPLLAAFVLLPLLGSTMSVLLLMALLGGAALLILRWKGLQGHQDYHRNFLTAAVGIMLVTVVVGPDWKILPPSFTRFGREILEYRESVEGTLTVGRDVDTRSRSQYTFVNNSAVIGSSYDAVKVVKMVGHFPFLLGLEAQDVLVIGFGIGVTTSAIAQHPEVESIECVELVPGLKDAARYYKELNRGIVDDPRLTIIPGDGRHYLQTTAKKYDLISCDPTHPILGSGALYTEDYFRQCREHLKPGGMVSQYLPLHKLRPEEFQGIVATFQAVFPHGTVWLGHYHAVLLGGLQELTMPFSQWADNVQKLGPDPDFYVNPYHLAATLMLDGPAIAERCGDRPLNTDDLSYTEFFDPDCLREDNIGRNLQWLAEVRIDPERLLTDCPRPDLMQRYLKGNNLLTESLYYRLQKDNVRSRQLLKEAIMANPEDQEFPFLMKLYF